MVLNVELLQNRNNSVHQNLIQRFFPTQWRMLQTFLLLIILAIMVWVIDQFSYLQNFKIPSAIQAVVNHITNFDHNNEPAEYFGCLSCNSADYNSLKNFHGLNNSVTNPKYYNQNMVLSPPAVYLEFREGIGNQLFQYACNYALSRKHDIPLYLRMPDDFFNSTNPRPFSANPSLDHFEIPLHPWNVVNSTWKLGPLTELEQIDDRKMLAGGYDLNKILHHTGLCQSETFFHPYKEEITTLFQQVKPKLYPAIMSSAVKKWLNRIEDAGTNNSVGVQIRQGDVPEVNRVPLAYYKAAMQQISAELEYTNTANHHRLAFFLFIEDSEEIEILKKELLYDQETTVWLNQLHFISSDEINELQYLYLLSRCSHQIILYNSFGWWAAYLNANPGKIVYAPHFDPEEIKLMYKNESEEGIYYMQWQYKNLYYPENWHILDTETIR